MCVCLHQEEGSHCGVPGIKEGGVGVTLSASDPITGGESGGREGPTKTEGEMRLDLRQALGT